ncbi:MAG: TRAP transporter small permease [Gemmatimonadota bacterium]|nr:TRAP transporter small permease [Gemmatimonadota bacterium]
MRKAGLLKRIFAFVLDVLEIYIPLVTFSIMFVAFVVQIFFRYVLNAPLTWPHEITLIAFIWTTLLGACYARRLNAHVCFGVVYDLLTPARQLVVRLTGNGIIVIVFCAALYPCYDFVAFMEFQKTTVARIPFSIVYFPFVVFMVLIIGHSLNDIIADFKKLVKEKA